MKKDKRKYLLLFGMMTVLYSNIFAQISEGGFPPSFYYDQSLRSRKLTEVPVDFYVEDLRETDNWRAREGVPMPVAKLIEVNYTPDNSGEWITLPNGERVWQLKLKAEGAVAIMLCYNDFYIPTDGKLFIYSPDKSQLLGAYTNKTNPCGGLFATEFIGGRELVLEYVASTESNENPRIIISGIGYGYNASALRAFCSIDLRATSGSCEVNVNCEESSAWQNEKRGVCHTIQKIGYVFYICSAVLLNNTAEDFKPLILTARHCAYDGSRLASVDDMKQWMFYFNYEREGCENNTPAMQKKTMTGCSLAAYTETEGQSDGMLLLLNQMIPEEYDVYYNGWDRRDVAPNSGVCLHHPEGDYMKISTYGQPATITTFESAEFKGGKDMHLNVTFMQTANGFGITEAGSSGSPLFNENKFVTGTLTGGNSSCIYTRGLNLYGRLYSHWGKYNADPYSQIGMWLDPLNTGVETFSGRYYNELRPAPTDLQAMNQGQGVYLLWKAPVGNTGVEKYNIYRNNQKINETTRLDYLDKDAIDGENTYSVCAVYSSGEESTSSGEESTFITATISFVKYKTPTNLQAVRTTQSKVKISWQAPIYEQTIYWGSLNKANKIGFGGNISFYFGQKWQSSELTTLNLNIIKSIQFVPVEGNTYQIYIMQGDRQYRREIDNSTLKYDDLNTIDLSDPFVIDASEDLIIAIYVSFAGTDTPAFCDYGPAINGKGNIFSPDGITWYNLYDENAPGEDFNFIVAAVVSSGKGVISPLRSNGHVEKITTPNSILKPRSVQKVQLSATVGSQNSAPPTSFPQITGYKIYRMGSSYLTVDATEDSYIDITSSNHYIYEVSAFYGDMESPKSNQVGISTVAVENVDDSVDILPSAFSNSVHFKGHEYSSHVDVISANGKICIRLNNASQTINTSALTPGIYFFRIYGDNNKVLRVVKTVKVN
ncbi:MAG: T9SS type A sorting domain-containing protein [Tannerella sp.]|jgi:hypothetical protein|nr:T9SS type A sorting domain-containing protein [Tannerella sp.]